MRISHYSQKAPSRVWRNLLRIPVMLAGFLGRSMVKKSLVTRELGLPSGRTTVSMGPCPSGSTRPNSIAFRFTQLRRIDGGYGPCARRGSLGLQALVYNHLRQACRRGTQTACKPCRVRGSVIPRRIPPLACEPNQRAFQREPGTDDLQSWALATLGVTDPVEMAAMTPAQAAFRFAADAADEVNATRYLDEEALTGMLLGALLSQLPWTTLAFGYASGGGDACYWSHYSKYSRNDLSESRLGADFALVLQGPDTNVKVDVFQAKRETVGTVGSIDIGQSRADEAGNVLK
jgi:hypothetical protein